MSCGLITLLRCIYNCNKYSPGLLVLLLMTVFNLGLLLRRKQIMRTIIITIRPVMIAQNITTMTAITQTSIPICRPSLLCSCGGGVGTAVSDAAVILLAGERGVM